MEETLEQKSQSNWLPYVLPIGVFLAVTMAEGQFPDDYVWVYFAKIILTGGALIWARSTWSDIKWTPKYIPISIILGVALCAIWIAIEEFVPYAHMGERTAYNPFEKIPDEGLRMAFISVRMFGLVLLVPFMEELFWRSFALRFATHPEFQLLKIGQFTLTAAATVCVLFALAHPEWLPALIYAVALTILVGRTKSIFACFVTHLVTNLSLGIYVLTQGAWKYW